MRSHLVKTCSFLFILAVIVSLVFSQSPQSVQPAAEPPAEQAAAIGTAAPARIADEATLNLHRWGAVTIFHGLPSDRVNAIAEDASGLLWFGTDNGLVSYDGRNVQALAARGSLPSRRILALKLDARGNLWIGTDAGAVRLLDDRLETLTETLGRAVTGIAVSAQNEVAIVTDRGEILRYHETSDEYLRSERASSKHLIASKIDRNSQPLLKSSNQENDILRLNAASFTQTGELVIGSSGRGALINSGSNLREAVTRPLRPYFVTSLFADGNRVWIGELASRQAGGLWVLNNETLSKSTINIRAITALYGSNNDLWAGTNRQGAFLLKLEGENAKLVEHLTFENTAGGLRSNQIFTIFRDHEGIVWFGTDHGVCRYDRDSFRSANVSNNPQSNVVWSLLRSSSGETYAGTNRGLFRLSTDTNDAVVASWSEMAELQGHIVRALHQDESGGLWAGTDGGLFVRAVDSSGFSRFSPTPEMMVTIENETDADATNLRPEIPNLSSREIVRALATFRQDLYAALLGRGIERIEVSKDSKKRELVLSNASAQRAICFGVEGEKALWFGTIDGELHRFDGSQTTSYVVPKKQSGTSSDLSVRAIQIAGERIWIGTSQGLYVREGNTIRNIIPDVDVQALLVMRESAEREIVWCATKNTGLLKFLPDKNLTARFNTEQGLTSEQVFALASNDSDIWIGTNRGVIRHHPSSIEPRLQITRLVADKIYLPDELTAELSLPHTMQYLLLEVTGISSRTFASQFQYEFILQNRSGQELQRVKTYDPHFPVNDLRSGAYAIVARAISRDLVYSAPLTLRLRIRNAPPPWPMLLLTSLLAIAVAAAVWAFRQQRRLARTNRALEETNTELHETRLRLAKETEAERSRIARDLHDQTLSDLRHLLVLTDQLPVAGIDDSSPPPALLRREIESISNEIRHICEDLSPSVLENIGFLPALEWALSDAVAHLPAEEKFSYEFICETELEDRLQLSHIEKIQLYRIVQEALNNICRHAKAKEVKMIVRSEDASDLMIIIEDDGIGFDGLTMKRTGHGIANIHSRANLIGAQVEWRNANPGCRFDVRIRNRRENTKQTKKLIADS